jgi:hypothetical protein
MKLPINYSTGFESDDQALIRLVKNQAGQICFAKQQVKANWDSFYNVKKLFVGDQLTIVLCADNSVMVLLGDIIEVFPDATDYLSTLYFGDCNFNDLDEGLKEFLVYQFGSELDAEAFVSSRYM